MAKDIYGKLDALSDELYQLAKARTREIMISAGENPDADKLFRIRVGQVLLEAEIMLKRENTSHE